MIRHLEGSFCLCFIYLFIFSFFSECSYWYFSIISLLLQIPWDNKLLSIAGHTKDPSETIQGRNCYFLSFPYDVMFPVTINHFISRCIEHLDLGLYSYIMLCNNFFFLLSHDSEGIWSTDLQLVSLKDLWKATGILSVSLVICTLAHLIRVYTLPVN